MKKIIFTITGLIIFFVTFCYAENKLELKCESAYLIEESTGKVLYAYNEDEQLRPASVTKVMTILLIMEAIDRGDISLTDMVPCSERARSMGGSQIWLDTREQLSVDDMLKAICIVSANDCCVAMAEFIAGSEETFVEKMNNRADELGMTNTVFKNCHGIDEEGHLTTAHDIGIMSRQLLTHNKVLDYTTVWMDSLRNGKSQLVNTNKLIRFYNGANGLKTGSTSLALYNLAGSAKRNDMQLIGVVMKSPTSKDRISDATKLLDFGFTNYEIKKFGKCGDILGAYKVEKGDIKEVNGILEKDISVLTKRGENKEIKSEINIENLTAPIKKGSKIGEVVYKTGEIEIGRYNIIAERDIGKNTFTKIFSHLMISWVKVGRG